MAFHLSALQLEGGVHRAREHLSLSAQGVARKLRGGPHRSAQQAAPELSAAVPDLSGGGLERDLGCLSLAQRAQVAFDCKRAFAAVKGVIRAGSGNRHARKSAVSKCLYLHSSRSPARGRDLRGGLSGEAPDADERSKQRLELGFHGSAHFPALFLVIHRTRRIHGSAVTLSLCGEINHAAPVSHLSRKVGNGQLLESRNLDHAAHDFDFTLERVVLKAVLARHGSGPNSGPPVIGQRGVALKIGGKIQRLERVTQLGLRLTILRVQCEVGVSAVTFPLERVQRKGAVGQGEGCAPNLDRHALEFQALWRDFPGGPAPVGGRARGGGG